MSPTKSIGFQVLLAFPSVSESCLWQLGEIIISTFPANTVWNRSFRKTLLVKNSLIRKECECFTCLEGQHPHPGCKEHLLRILNVMWLQRPKGSKVYVILKEECVSMKMSLGKINKQTKKHTHESKTKYKKLKSLKLLAWIYF